MKTRTMIELSIGLVFGCGMLVWGFRCEPGHCMEMHDQWLAMWFGGWWVFITYKIWTME